MFFGKGLIEELNFKGNMLVDEGFEELIEVFRKKECWLKILNIVENDIISLGVLKLFLVFELNICLEELNFSCNEICG